MSETTPKAKSLDLLKTRTFQANGHTYHLVKEIPISRWREYEKLEPQLTYGLSFKEMQQQLTKAYNSLNSKEGRWADAAVIIHNILSGLKAIESETRNHPALMLAALVINREGEDAGVYNEALQIEKISDWEKEGYDVTPFFTFALISIQGFRESYLEFIASEMAKNESLKLSNTSK